MSFSGHSSAMEKAKQEETPAELMKGAILNSNKYLLDFLLKKNDLANIELNWKEETWTPIMLAAKTATRRDFDTTKKIIKKLWEKGGELQTTINGTSLRAHLLVGDTELKPWLSKLAQTERSKESCCSCFG